MLFHLLSWCWCCLNWKASPHVKTILHVIVDIRRFRFGNIENALMESVCERVLAAIAAYMVMTFSIQSCTLVVSDMLWWHMSVQQKSKSTDRSLLNAEQVGRGTSINRKIESRKRKQWNSTQSTPASSWREYSIARIRRNKLNWFVVKISEGTFAI